MTPSVVHCTRASLTTTTRAAEITQADERRERKKKTVIQRETIKYSSIVSPSSFSFSQHLNHTKANNCRSYQRDIHSSCRPSLSVLWWQSSRSLAIQAGKLYMVGMSYFCESNIAVCDENSECMWKVKHGKWWYSQYSHRRGGGFVCSISLVILYAIICRT